MCIGLDNPDNQLSFRFSILTMKNKSLKTSLIIRHVPFDVEMPRRQLLFCCYTIAMKFLAGQGWHSGTYVVISCGRISHGIILSIFLCIIQNAVC